MTPPNIRTKLGLGLLSILAAAGLCGFAGQARFGDPDDGWANQPEFATSRAICRRFKTLAVPASDMPDPATAATLKGCSSEALYYGIGVKRDPVKARQCAILELNDPDNRDGVFSGTGMLMTIYATGFGAKKDLDLATHMACNTWGAPVDTDILVHALQTRKTVPDPTPFDYCYDVNQGASDVSMPVCAWHEQRRTKAVRDVKVQALTAAWTAEESAAHDQLLKAQGAFLELRQMNERGAGTINRSATARFEMELEDDRLALLQRMTASKGPTASPAQRTAADTALNQFYRNLMPLLPQKEMVDYDVTKPGVREAQRAWIAYRDAWLALAAVKWPNASQDGLATYLTRKRLGHLHCDAYHNGDERFEQECG
ncbi:lysozyme inhibitor LprI family protein [Caulobacter sp. Root1455]|uniref:lysozyme inhibitor LprI family protein n=1 Tax=Caulobacter sp. Root1455 TaxID=1736465 RepID=UPI0009E6E018|nr:lysozyme inhibitor LprI family protein [Caulobacter sp. Root1455]